MSLLDRFTRHVARLRLPPGRVLVAVSGGADSVALLDLLVLSREALGLEPVAAHLDHGIHPESAQVAARVQRLAAGLGLPCIVGRLGLGPAASETRARAARYRWLEAARRDADARLILTAHHADDQVETVLMRLLRGSGPAGLAGMPARRGKLVRPLLPFGRESLRRYCRARALPWWEDPANRDPRHLRAWLRHDVVPMLERRLPDLPTRIRRTARLAARDRAAWREALEAWPGLDWRCAAGTVSIAWPVLNRLPAALRTQLATALVRSAGGVPGPSRVRRALAALAAAPSGAIAELGGGWRFELAFGRLDVVAPGGDSPPGDAVVLGSGSGETAWGPWRVRWGPEPAPARQPRAGSTAWFVPGALTLRSWRPGDRLAPLRGRGHRLAVRCFQDARVPRSRRAAWPMIEGEGELAWIQGVCRSDRRVPEPGSPALRVDVEPRD